MEKPRPFFLLLTPLLLALIALFLIKAKQAPDVSEKELKSIKINGQEILVEIADTPEKMAQGLADRPSLPENRGMLFVFDKPGYYSFWMKDTLIPLDFVWIRDRQVVEATSDVQPQDFPPPKTLTPSQKVDHVLEINAGTAERLNLNPGDQVEF